MEVWAEESDPNHHHGGRRRDDEGGDDEVEEIQAQLKSVRAWWVGGWWVDLRNRNAFVQGKERPGATSQR